MASESEVRKYIAYWFQLGKKVFIRNGSEALLPKSVIAGDRYSREFEECWQKIISPDSGDSYLQGTNETIAQLLTPAWEISPCARCAMPVVFPQTGMPPECCPCNDLANWPDTEMPQPRSPVSTKSQLSSIRDRLLRTPGE
ncbi:MAG: hypothetical protein JGK17_27190 [Microcoleus sp. PH2017_10_PVI_O_A]|uniref:hypothetical protein n=1 Tax=unclassified Microcoleus TaxID=2642155 RepID=UPI001E05179F|nr:MULTISPECIES: hypothetical protein [unclassified Microcoleus]TAE76763.1 MAG: hypothetical protein EAZ83_27590 [Oscillatoriales cyanobacterium]MCC3409187.1 hypothetical protein [Microcoleus sp. PH2017_10_PVI_O_A]MCC3463424.1 hypothetical protein [Microcoleus sp. PH2017_11_PCY_U_A]MCC3481791.1 hypothetical protein [Microcoleus sp. PH2017_12_PCY_D_A]MCC3530822.1 hypothetical protein [Microcoleus sp. PH2017_21_RUC_O_A]